MYPLQTLWALIRNSEIIKLSTNTSNPDGNNDPVKWTNMMERINSLIEWLSTLCLFFRLQTRSKSRLSPVAYDRLAKVGIRDAFSSKFKQSCVWMWWESSFLTGLISVSVKMFAMFLNCVHRNFTEKPLILAILIRNF